MKIMEKTLKEGVVVQEVTLEWRRSLISVIESSTETYAHQFLAWLINTTQTHLELPNGDGIVDMYDKV